MKHEIVVVVLVAVAIPADADDDDAVPERFISTFKWFNFEKKISFL